MNVFFLLILVLLTGCETISNIHAPQKMKMNLSMSLKDLAVIIVSTNAPAPCGASNTFLMVAPAGGTYYQSNGIARLDIDNRYIKSDFEDHKGSLNAIMVKPGNYQLFPGSGHIYYQPIKVPKAEILVRAGEVVYIGEYYMTESCGTSTAGIFRDNEARDIALLQKLNPDFLGVLITKRIATFNGYVPIR